MIALLVNVIGAGQPALVESVLNPARGVNGVRRFVRRADQIAGGACAARQAARTREAVPPLKLHGPLA